MKRQQSKDQLTQSSNRYSSRPRANQYTGTAIPIVNFNTGSSQSGGDFDTTDHDEPATNRTPIGIVENGYFNTHSTLRPQTLRAMTPESSNQFTNQAYLAAHLEREIN